MNIKPTKEITLLLANAVDGIKTEKTDIAINTIKELATNVISGSTVEKIESYAKLNALLEVTIDPKAQTNLREVVSNYGELHQLNRREAAEIVRYEHELRGGRNQAQSGDVRFGKTVRVNAPVVFETISAGIEVDYRDLIEDTTMQLQNLIVETLTTIDNKVVAKVSHELAEGVKTASTNGKVTYYASGNGVAKATLDEAITQVRRTGNVNIFGDYRMVSQLEDFVGFSAAEYRVLAEARLLEIDAQGFIGQYRASTVSEIKNALDVYAKEDNTIFGKTYKTLLPESDLYIMANGTMAPNHIFTRGGLTTQTGSFIPSGSEMQRWDLEVATYFVEDRAYMMGLIQDTDLI